MKLIEQPDSAGEGISVIRKRQGKVVAKSVLRLIPFVSQYLIDVVLVGLK